MHESKIKALPSMISNCESKRKYTMLKDVLAEVKRRGTNVIHYKCKVCFYYHIGRYKV